MERRDESWRALLGDAGARLRVRAGRVARRVGLGEDSLMVPLAVLVGVLAAGAAVGFHELILFIRDNLYRRAGAETLYGYGWWLLILFPAAGGLVVGLLSRFFGDKEGHGVVDVMESVSRSRGFVRPRTAIEKILTSAVTIGSGGSTGAEGPIVQIGAAISGGVGAVFRVARHRMPILVGCGCAAGISAIFNAPIGGLLFTLEVILLDFSLRTLAPIVVASVVANVTMRAILARMHEGEAYITIFADPAIAFERIFAGDVLLDWPQMGNYVLLGLVCGGIGVALARSLATGETLFRGLLPGRAFRGWGRVARPAVGGAMLGVLGVMALLVAPAAVGGAAGGPIGFGQYPMPAFYGDGYGVIEVLLTGDLFSALTPLAAVGLLAGLCAIKLVATVLTLASGGSGGVIAPSLFLGATAGGAVGVLLRETGWFVDLRPEAYALIGMAAVLTAVVHAPLASVLILFEITGENRVMLAAMPAVVVALYTAKLVTPDSVYTAALRRRGVRLGAGDPALLQRLSVEQLPLEPATVVSDADPLERVIDLADKTGARELIVLDAKGNYAGFVGGEDLSAAVLRREASPLLVAGEVMRTDVPLLAHTDDLRRAFELFAQYETATLPVGLSGERKVIGLLTRTTLLRRWREAGEG